MTDIGQPAEPVGRVLVIGGARSGKSTFAESMLSGRRDVVYVASWSDPVDAEWASRVARHRSSRPQTWMTVETADVAAALRSRDDCFLVDCVTTWLAAAMTEAGCWDERPEADDMLTTKLDDLLSAYSAATEAVVVTNELGQGVVPATTSGRLFRDEMGRLNQRLAAASDSVWFITAGIPTRLR